MNWNKFAESQQGDEEAGARALSGEAVGIAFSQGKKEHLRAAFRYL